MHREWITKSEQETLAVGKSIAASLKPGDVLALNGDLGAGKTVFVRGIARGLGVEGLVNSPTYTIVHEYAGRYPLYHFDVYRIEDEQEMLDTGYYDYLEQGIVVIEWAELISGILPKKHAEVCIEKLDADTRKITIESVE